MHPAVSPLLTDLYRLSMTQEYAGLPRRNRSTGKATWPRRKQVWRHYGPDGRMRRDIVSVERHDQPGEPLIELVMKGGRRPTPQPTLAEIRAGAARGLERLPDPLRRLKPGASYRWRSQTP